jgi:superfamily II RNA helicase
LTEPVIPFSSNSIFQQQFVDRIGFTPDAFQLDAIDCIDEGNSVVVCAPTGSGKTLIAEFAAYKALEENTKLIYTTPLKALNNQKYHDFVAQYGPDNVGLLTGDVSINRDAPIVVMTTEVFRNMVYGIQEDSQILGQVRYVVLDECHYMNDTQRGTVWEESIIHCPDNIHIIALSATVANAEELTAWINSLHPGTRLISSDFRPVPLRHFFFATEQNQLFSMFKPGSTEMNPQLKRFGQFNPRAKGHSKQAPKAAFYPNRLIRVMAEKDMLPAIFFTFSRKGCDRGLADTLNLDLLTPQERREIDAFINEMVAENPVLENNRYLDAIRNGFASHHAGLLPAVKVLVEKLFQRGLIKVVFATETLAAGINMPARSTVITAVSKRTDTGHRMLTASEFLQMSGRAGRRGMDTSGNVITVSSPYESASEMALLARSHPEPLNSQFSPSYGMVINLLDRYSLDEAQVLVGRSFGAFTMGRKLAPLFNDKKRYEGAERDFQQFVCPAKLTADDFKRYLHTKDLLTTVYHELGVYKNQLKRYGQQPEVLQAQEAGRAKRDSLKADLAQYACETCDIFKTHIQAYKGAEKAAHKLGKIDQLIDAESQAYWQQFLSHYQLLKAQGYLDTDDKPNPYGIMMGDIKTENEFFLTEVILSHALDKLSPPALAAVIAAVISDDRKDRSVCNIRLSNEGFEAIKQIRGLAKKFDHLQGRFQVMTPIRVSHTAVGIVEAWTAGMSWTDLIQQSDLDEGDLVRQLRRVADVLRQLTRVRNIPKNLSDTASAALYSLYRAPVIDDDLAAEAPEFATMLSKESLSKEILESPPEEAPLDVDSHHR